MATKTHEGSHADTPFLLQHGHRNNLLRRKEGYVYFAEVLGDGSIGTEKSGSEY